MYYVEKIVKFSEFCILFNIFYLLGYIFYDRQVIERCRVI